MRAEIFLDTNILLYAASKTAAEKAKRARARELLAGEGVGLSVQVLAEFYVNATGKFKLPHDQVVKVLETFEAIRFFRSPTACSGPRWPSAGAIESPTGMPPSSPPPLPSAATRPSPRTSTTARSTRGARVLDPFRE